MGVMQTIERLVSFGPRWTGMEGDGRTTEHLAGELEGMGREAARDEISVRPAYHVTHGIHCALGAAGSLLAATASPPLGLLILLLAGISMYGDLTGRYHLIRRLTPRRQTSNVTSRGRNGDAPARVVLTAHHDAARSGLLYVRRRRRRPRARQSVPSRLAGPVDLAFWTLAAALVVAAVRLITGEESTAMKVAQFIPTVGLMAFVVFFGDIATSKVVPGASDNASGVAAVLEVARRLERDPAHHLDVWIVFPAAKEGFMLGMREWLRAHREDLDPNATYFVNVDTVGNGTVHHVTAEGFALAYRHDQALIELCEEIGSAPRVWRLGTDGVIPAMAGFSSITICCADEAGRMPNFHRTSDTVENVEPAAVEGATEFVEDLVRRIDRAIRRRRSAQDGAAPASR